MLTYQDSARRLGADRAFSFQVDGDLKSASEFLAGKLDRRLVSSFARPTGNVLAQLAVKHLRPISGDEGTLTFGEDAVTYQSNDKRESRSWSYRDIESIATSDVFHLTLTTYEGQRLHYATRRVFNFQLKQPLPEDTYDKLWRRVNAGQGLELFEKLRSELEQQTTTAVAQTETPETISPQMTPMRGEPALSSGIFVFSGRIAAINPAGSASNKA